MKSWLCL